MTGVEDSKREDGAQNAGITGDDLLASNRLTGRDFRFITPEIRHDELVLQGQFRLLQLKSGLVLHATDAVDLHDLRTEVMHEAGITLGVFLHGRADISVGSHHLQLGAATGAATAQAFMLAYAEPDHFIRRGIRGNRARKVCINIPPEWLAEQDDAESEDLRRLMQHHAGHAVWQPSRRHLMLAEQILAPSPFGALLYRLQLESAAIDIVADALGILTEDASASALIQRRDLKRIEDACEYIEACGDDKPHLDDVARHVGMSVSALQRLFRRIHGEAIFDHVRNRRLDRAFQMLEQGKASVTEAAFIAGYTTSANFATAFRRRFGTAPSEIRKRVTGFRQ